MTHWFHHAKTMARDCLVRFARVTKRASLGRALLALRRSLSHSSEATTLVGISITLTFRALATLRERDTADTTHRLLALV